MLEVPPVGFEPTLERV